ncbi:glycosyltransferase family 4 protein [Kordiimonas sp. SCSIO 12610]|uniref:glycosyltransferase family 4 protein n=1 Tax=Kordiimonas sp. SCSIO 12610 TaxID=2829597 RepID=UPI00210D0B8A|nr:glycosyltransferase family 4 protein [Kordiimonas sp. SCSIO 12610]UTW56358.1 glycosyltransferase family 4 protein [Kordiimonas sp. SCSIO 12610]
MQHDPHILHVFPSFEIGGAQRRTAALLNGGFSEFRHSILALDKNYEAIELINSTRQNVFALTDLEFPKSNMIKAGFQARKHLKAIQPDLLVTYNWGSVEWNLANMAMPVCPMIHIQDGFGVEEQQTELSRRIRTRRQAYRKCNTVIVPSKTLYETADKSWFITPSKTKYIPNGIHTDRFQAAPDAECMQQYGLSKQDFIVGTVAALRPEKNLSKLIEAFSIFRQNIPSDTERTAKLVIVGNGNERDRLKQITHDLNIENHVVFTGMLDRPERILAAFDLYALTSKTEQMPISVIEAMASGLPIVSTKVGDVPSMVSSENSSLITGHAATAIARNLKLLYDNPDIGKEIGAKNRNKAQETFSFDTMLAAYENCFAAAISKPH